MVAIGDEVMAIKDYGTATIGGVIYKVSSVDTRGFGIEMMGPIIGSYQMYFFHAEFNTYFKPYRTSISPKNAWIQTYSAPILHKETIKPVKKCTCGEATLRGLNHSRWCDIV